MPKIKKVIDRNYTVVDNRVLNDTRLTLKAKGLFVYLWSQADNWTYYEKEVVKHSQDGLASLRTGLQELETYGYLVRKRNREKGQFKDPVWLLNPDPKPIAPKCENRALVKDDKKSEKRTGKELSTDNVPRFDFPKLGKPILEKPTLENRTLTNTNLNNYQSKQILIDKSLSQGDEREPEQTYKFQAISHYFAKYDHPLTKRESSKLTKKGKNIPYQVLQAQAEKAICLASTYPFGYFMSLLDNLPDTPNQEAE